MRLNLLGESEDESLLESEDESLLESEDESLLESEDESLIESPFRPRNYGRAARGLSGGTMALPAGGNAQVRFSKAVVSQQDFRRAMNMIRSDIRRNQQAIAKLDKRVTGRLKSISSRAEQSSMLPIFLTMMQPKPQLESITFAADPTAGPNTVTGSTIRQQDTMLPLILMMGMGGGGLFGQGESEKGGGGMQQMMMMVLLMQAMK